MTPRNGIVREISNMTLTDELTHTLRECYLGLKLLVSNGRPSGTLENPFTFNRVSTSFGPIVLLILLGLTHVTEHGH